MEEISDQAAQRMSQILTTEHFTLQGARNGTISEANGRLGHYLSTVGSGVVALAFVANVSQLGPVFLVFSSVIFPILIALGVMTLVRIIQIGVHDFRLTQAINRIRHYYLEIAPKAEPYFSFPHYDDTDAVQYAMMPFHFPLQDLATSPGPVIMINSFLTGTFAGVLAFGFFSVSLVPAMVIAVSALVLSFILHRIYSGRVWRQMTRVSMEVRFPSPQD